MGERLDHQPRPHDVGQREPALEPAVGAGADDPADRDRRRQEPVPDRGHPEALIRIEDQHGPSRAERDVERDDREEERAHRGVGEQPPEAFCEVGANGRSTRRALVGRLVRDPEDQDRAEGEAGGVRRERERHADHEQRRADGRGNQLVGQQGGAGQAGVRDAQVLAPDEPGQEAAAADVGERLRGREDEQRDQDDGDARRAADDRGRQQPQDHGSDHVDGGDDPPAVVAVGDDAGEHPEQQRRQRLAEQRQRDQERVLRQRGDEERAGGERDPVADVGHGRGGEQPAEAPAESRRGDGLDGAGDRGRHAARVPAGQRLGTVPTCRVTMPPVRPRQWTSTRPASRMISATRSGAG